MAIIAAYSMADMENLRTANFARKQRSDKGKKRGSRGSGVKALADDGTGRVKMNKKGLAAGEAAYNNAAKGRFFKNAIESVKGAVKSDLRNAKQILTAKGKFGAERGVKVEGVADSFAKRLSGPTKGGANLGSVYRGKSSGLLNGTYQNARGRGAEAISGIRKVGEVVKRTGVGKAGAALALGGLAAGGYAGYRALNKKKKGRK